MLIHSNNNNVCACGGGGGGGVRVCVCGRGGGRGLFCEVIEMCVDIYRKLLFHITTPPLPPMNRYV